MKLTKVATEANIFVFPRTRLIGANLELAGLIQDLMNIVLGGNVEAEVNVTGEQDETKSQSQSESGSQPAQTTVKPQEASGAGVKEKVASLAEPAVWQEASPTEAAEALADVIVKLSNLAKQIVRVVEGSTEIASALGLEDDAEFSERLIKILVVGLSAHTDSREVQLFLNGASANAHGFCEVLDKVLREYFDKKEHRKEITKAVRVILSKGIQNAAYMGSMSIDFLSEWFLSDLRRRLRKETNWQAQILPETQVGGQK